MFKEKVGLFSTLSFSKKHDKKPIKAIINQDSTYITWLLQKEFITLNTEAQDYYIRVITRSIQPKGKQAAKIKPPKSKDTWKLKHLHGSDSSISYPGKVPGGIQKKGVDLNYSVRDEKGRLQLLYVLIQKNPTFVQKLIEMNQLVLNNKAQEFLNKQSA